MLDQLIPIPDTDRPPPTWHHAPVVEHRPVGDRHQHLTVHAPSIAATALPGQFVMLTVARDGESGPVLPRPMAIFDTDRVRGTIDVVYGVVGSGTQKLSSFAAGETMLVVGPLGRGFELAGVRRVLLLGRGIGTCSLTTVASVPGLSTVAVISARNPGALIGAEVYRRFGAQVLEVTDADGSSDPAALKRHLLELEPPQAVFTCGSQRLADLAADLGHEWGADVQVSVEAHMACGLGYCHGCSSGRRAVGTEDPLVCLDGPVFRLGV